MPGISCCVMSGRIAASTTVWTFSASVPASLATWTASAARISKVRRGLFTMRPDLAAAIGLGQRVNLKPAACSNCTSALAHPGYLAILRSTLVTTPPWKVKMVKVCGSRACGK